jgi:hypothetical protein
VRLFLPFLIVSPRFRDMVDGAVSSPDHPLSSIPIARTSRGITHTNSSPAGGLGQIIVRGRSTKSCELLQRLLGWTWGETLFFICREGTGRRDAGNCRVRYHGSINVRSVIKAIGIIAVHRLDASRLWVDLYS